MTTVVSAQEVTITNGNGNSEMSTIILDSSHSYNLMDDDSNCNVGSSLILQNNGKDLDNNCETNNNFKSDLTDIDLALDNINNKELINCSDAKNSSCNNINETKVDFSLLGGHCVNRATQENLLNEKCKLSSSHSINVIIPTVVNNESDLLSTDDCNKSDRSPVLSELNGIKSEDNAFGKSTSKTSSGIDVKLQSLTKDDSTDIDVSYSSDSLSPESDQDLGSSFVDSSYQQLQQDIEEKFKCEIDRLKSQIKSLEKEVAHEVCQNQISTLEKTMEQMKLELELSNQEHALDSQTFANERLQLESKLENLEKEFLAAKKDKEAAVVKYACGEVELINQKKEKELAEKKLKDCVKEKEVLFNKLKTVSSEKTRVCHMLDNKCSELTTAQKEIDNMKEELNSREIKIKWLQNKQKSEMDTRKELESKVEQLSDKLREAVQEAERAKHDAVESIKKFQESEENKAYVISQQLKEEQVKLLVVQHEQEEVAQLKKQLLLELESCRANLKLNIEENNNLATKVQTLEKERLDYEQNLSQLKQKTDFQSKIIADLQHTVKDMEALRVQLQCEQERVTNSQSEMERLRSSNFELLQDMESCRKREADMLEFTQKLTAKNVRLQSEFSAVEAKAQQLECEEAPLQKKIVELDGKASSLMKALDKEKAQRTEESKVLARHIAEKTALAKTLEKQVEELTNEIQLLKRKDAATIKELNRELSQLRRRLEHVDNGSGSDSLCQGSRTSSCTSLNENYVSSQPPQVSTATNISQVNLQVEPNRQTLIERIVKLQRDNAKSNEKIDFLEEHTRTLLSEVQKKSKLLQSYILREEAGALSSRSMDLNKAELTKHGGIMASVYGSKSVDENMTFELSLEINRKLQAVLEDTLLKNITLKENIDTLGDEIARLSKKS